MAGESPGGGAVQTGAGERVEAQLGCSGVDVVGDGLQGIEVGDLIEGMAGLLQQRLVDDDAERLVAIADGYQLVAVIEVEIGGGEFLYEIGVGEIQRVLAPGLHGALVADLEHGGGGVLIHFSGKGVVVFAGSGGHDLDFHAGLLGVGLGQILPGLIRFGLEVQVVDLAGGGIGGLGGVRGRFRSRFAGAGAEREHDAQNEQDCKEFLHE